MKIENNKHTDSKYQYVLIIRHYRHSKKIITSAKSAAILLTYEEETLIFLLLQIVGQHEEISMFTIMQTIETIQFFYFKTNNPIRTSASSHVRRYK